MILKILELNNMKFTN